MNYYSATNRSKNLYISRLWKKRWGKAVTFMAAIVVFCTVYALILPAITLESQTTCGKEEHVHTEACYEDQSALICEKVEHIHDELCYEAQAVLICGQEEVLPHFHDDSCFYETTVLTCELEQDETHTHGNKCYEISQELICGRVETEGHSHGSDCYEIVSVLMCKLEEHQHEDGCSKIETALTCGKEEHQHTESCFAKTSAAPDADIETSDEWEATFAHLQLSGCWSSDIAAIAETQIGYQESTLNFITTEDGEAKGYTRYGAWYGNPYDDWNVMFASFCIHYARVEQFPLERDCAEWVQELKKDEYGHYRNVNEYTPTTGDLVFFDYDGDQSADHVGIVKLLAIENESADYFETIEGDVLGGVTYATHAMHEATILGFARIPENPNYTGTGEASGIDTPDDATEAVPAESGENQITISSVTESGLTISAFLPSYLQSEDDANLQLVVNELPNGEKTFEQISEIVASKNMTIEKVAVLHLSVWMDDEEFDISDVSLITVEGANPQTDVFFIVSEEQAEERSPEWTEDSVAVLSDEYLPVFSVVTVTPAEEHPKEERTLSAVTEDGITVTLTGPEDSFPGDIGDIEMRVRNMNEEDSPDATDAFERLQTSLDEAGLGSRKTLLLDISLWLNGEEIEPVGPVVVTVAGLEDVSSVYHVNEEEINEVPTYQTEDADIAFETDHFSFYGFVSVNELSATAAETTSLTVDKVWADFWNSHSSVTVRLYYTDGDGNTAEVSGVAPVVLTEQNNWTATFTDLPIPSDGGSYSVVEEDAEGYTAQYSDVTEVQSVAGSVWVPVSGNTLVSGKTYVFRVSNSNYALGQNGKYLIRQSITVNSTPITANGVTYSQYLSDVTADAQWTVTSSGSGFNFMNGRSYYIEEDEAVTSKSKATPMQYDSNGRIRCISKKEYLMWNGEQYELDTASNAEKFQLYELITLPAGANTYRATITNTPIPEPNSESLTVRKIWSDSWETHAPITVHLMKMDEYGVTTETGDTLTLSEENGWMDVFTGLEVSNDGSFAYSVYEEPLENYITKYSAITEQTQSGGVWVPVSNNQLVAGQTFAFYTTSGHVLSQQGTSKYVNRAAVTANGTLTLSGTTYSSYLTDVPEGAQWTVSSFGDYFRLRNGNNRNLYKAEVESSKSHSYTFDGKLYDVDEGKYLCWKSSESRYSTASSSSDAENFQLYVKLDMGFGGGGHEITITNTRVYPQQGEINVDAHINKTIDYLGDGVANPDTSLAGDDFYRLYLDVIGSHQPVDLLIVADMTVSMGYAFGTTTRANALDQIVNGTIISGSGATANRQMDGIIYNFLHMHPNNKVAVTGFSGGWSQVGQTYEGTKNSHNPITMSWTGLSGMPNGGATARDCYARVVNGGEPGGTNYTAGLMRAHEMLSDPSVVNDGNLKVMIFLTDGEPNRYINANGVITAEENAPYTNTYNYFVQWIQTHPNLITYIVGISPAANAGSAYTLLSGIANDTYSTYYPANDVSPLHDALRNIIDRSKFSLVEISDELSPYVEYYTPQPDLKVTRTDAQGNTTVVWQGDRPTAYNYDANGVRIINSVRFEAGDSDNPSGKVRVIFNPGCYLDGENTFTLSFNVKLSDYANEEYTESGYNATGDENTDYGTNTTSSLKPGFHSNQEAYTTFTTYEVGYKVNYPHPVVQTHIQKLMIDKISAVDGKPLANAVFDLYQAADSEDDDAVLLPTLTNVFGVKIRSISTDSTGSTDMITLLPGRYYLVETSAPNGYYAASKPIAFDVSATGISLVNDTAYADNAEVGTTDETNTIHLKISNQTSHRLPDTGGIGKEPFILGGLLLMAAAMICGYMRHRRERRAEM